MKRLTVLVIVLTGLAFVSFGQYGSRGSPRKVYQLTEPKLTGPVSFEQVLLKRRSVRTFTGLPLNLAQIGQLAWAGQGITDPERGFRTAPSAGATYPIELYFATKDGIFVYSPGDHSLEQTSDQDLRGRLATAVSEPEVVTEAACDIILAGSVRKLALKYGKQARRYLLLEAGHIAQNIQLQATSLELGSVSIAGFDIREVSKVCRLPKSLEPIYMICVGYPTEEALGGAEQVRQMRAAMIIAGGNFRDEELFETRLVLQDAGVETVVASSRTGPIKGMLGGVAEAVILVNELRVDDFDAIVFVGGPGATEYFDSPVALNIAREAAAKGKVLAAICIAPVVLANAGLLNGVRATAFLSERETLQVAGAEFTGAPVERDGLIITASDPSAANLFGRAIADTLSGR
ncbi:MAG: DJ-1/PfpI family protein [Planctomycetota bacterium]|jgi:protease I